MKYLMALLESADTGISQAQKDNHWDFSNGLYQLNMLEEDFGGLKGIIHGGYFS